MTSTRLSLPLAALAAALLFAVEGVLELVHDQHESFTGVMDYVIEAGFVVALVAGAAALLELRRDGGPRIPLAIAAAGHAGVAVAAAATFARGEDALGPIFMLGFLGITAGFAATAVQDARGRLAPKRAGLALAATWIVTVALNSVLPLAAAWLAVAALAKTSGATAPSPLRPATPVAA
jgi:hypothetical protein